MKAPYSPIIGEMPATKAKATASGTKAKATVSPDKISSLIFPCFLSMNWKDVFNFLFL